MELMYTRYSTKVKVKEVLHIKGGGQQVIQEPQCIQERNSYMYMGGVNKAGQLVKYYGCNNVSKKWWKRVCFHMLDMTLVTYCIINLQ